MNEVRRIYVETLCYPTEDKEKVLRALRTIAGGIKIVEGSIPSYYGPNIIVLSGKITRAKEIKAFVEKVRVQKLKDIDERVDETGVFHLRFDKQAALGGSMRVSEGGDVIKVRIKLTSYPFSLEKVREIARRLFG